MLWSCCLLAVDVVMWLALCGFQPVKKCWANGYEITLRRLARLSGRNYEEYLKIQIATCSPFLRSQESGRNNWLPQDWHRLSGAIAKATEPPIIMS